MGVYQYPLSSLEFNGLVCLIQFKTGGRIEYTLTPAGVGTPY